MCYVYVMMLACLECRMLVIRMLEYLECWLAMEVIPSFDYIYIFECIRSLKLEIVVIPQGMQNSLIQSTYAPAKFECISNLKLEIVILPQWMSNSLNSKCPPTKFECTIILKLAFAVLTTVNAKTYNFKRNILMLIK